MRWFLVFGFAALLGCSSEDERPAAAPAAKPSPAPLPHIPIARKHPSPKPPAADGISKGLSKGKYGPATAAVERVQALAETVCQCSSRACAQAAAQNLAQLARASFQVHTSPAAKAALEQASKKFSRCMAAVARRQGELPGAPEGSAPSPPADPRLLALGKLADRMCACEDLSCADAVEAELRRFAERFGEQPPSESVAQGLAVETARLQRCLLERRPERSAAPTSP